MGLDRKKDVSQSVSELYVSVRTVACSSLFHALLYVNATCIRERPEYPQLVHGVQYVLLGGRVHEVKVQQVLHAEGLEEEHHVGQVGPLDLRHGRGQELVAILTLRVQPGETGGGLLKIISVGIPTYA